MLAFWACASGPAPNVHFRPCIDTCFCSSTVLLVLPRSSNCPIAVCLGYLCLTHISFLASPCSGLCRCVPLLVQHYSQQCATSFASNPPSCCRPSCARPIGDSRVMSSWTGTRGACVCTQPHLSMCVHRGCLIVSAVTDIPLVEVFGALHPRIRGVLGVRWIGQILCWAGARRV
jgi:hypothetical protein